jgi:hypothetical protein
MHEFRMGSVGKSLLGVCEAGNVWGVSWRK